MALNAKQEKVFIESDLFNGCDIRCSREIAQTIHPIRIMKGHAISVPSPAPALGYVLDGSLDICNANGVLYFTLEAGSFFELDSMFSDVHPFLPHQLHARTNCVVTFVGKNLFAPFLHDNPRLSENYMKIMADMLQMTTCRLDQFTAATPSVALGLYLLRYEKQGSIRLADGFAGLARRLNISRATLYRSLAELEELGLVEHQEKTVHILHYDKLERYIRHHSVPMK